MIVSILQKGKLRPRKAEDTQGHTVNGLDPLEPRSEVLFLSVLSSMLPEVIPFGEKK